MVVVYTFGNLYSAFDAESSDENDRTQDKAPNHRPGLLFANATYATRKGPCDAHLYSATADHCTTRLKCWSGLLLSLFVKAAWQKTIGSSLNRLADVKRCVSESLRARVCVQKEKQRKKD